MDIAEHLRNLELDLLSNATRRDASRVSLLLADDFREFGGSGRVYTKKEVVLMLQDEAPAALSLIDFEMKAVAEGVALVTYRSSRDVPGGPPTISLRSSIWIREGEDWKMVFHQGTRLSSGAETAPLPGP